MKPFAKSLTKACVLLCGERNAPNRFTPPPLQFTPPSAFQSPLCNLLPPLQFTPPSAIYSPLGEIARGILLHPLHGQQAQGTPYIFVVISRYLLHRTHPLNKSVAKVLEFLRFHQNPKDFLGFLRSTRPTTPPSRNDQNWRGQSFLRGFCCRPQDFLEFPKISQDDTHPRFSSSFLVDVFNS